MQGWKLPFPPNLPLALSLLPLPLALAEIHSPILPARNKSIASPPFFILIYVDPQFLKSHTAASDPVLECGRMLDPDERLRWRLSGVRRVGAGVGDGGGRG
ncbi:hypothetical protein BDV98DRAFT_568696 [Pterulicium gracile]|uniref:Uncharacterized protein n=1 Tax=Pterulicium gracile TaxID=1884261 RepID=A0A5C3QI17_9AGAR|nr:hypothetical protein BDV98DRAFT_568696 [Pterula gracilis]